MAFMAVLISERRRQRLCIVGSFLATFIFASGMANIGAGLLFKRNFLQLAKLVILEEQFDFFGDFLIYVGASSTITGLVSAKIFLDIKRGGHYRSRCLAFVFLPHLILSITSTAMLGIIWGLYSLYKDIGFSDCSGFATKMLEYTSKRQTKIWIDWVQINFACCASKAHSEWFHINWIDGGDIQTKNEVPFSCCDPDKIQDCFYASAPKGVGMGGIYGRGCGQPLCSHLALACLITLYLLIVSFVLQLLTSVLMRYVRTSINNAGESGNPYGQGVGYLVDKCVFCPFLENYRVDNYAVPAETYT